MEGLVKKMKTAVRSNLGDIIKSKGLVQKWVAEQIGATPAQINKWSTNKDGLAVSTPHVLYILRLEKVLGVKVSEMYEEVK
ncbi:helix-turn-helix transcriptional regulator [Priestia flexa]|uniref:helix-turn-helix transcriptional regulator n=1 Tax=Priestia flexa TaxID=86664 RepID=UPI0004730561|nr:helix-turn-helix transcriptional regulator [Priestia flexa]